MAAAATTRKVAAKKTAAPATRSRAVKPRAAVKPKAASAPVVSGVLLEADRPAPQPEVFPIFAIGDVQYYAPVKPSPSVGLTVMYKARHESEDSAVAYLLEAMLGDVGYRALMNYEALTSDDLTNIVALLRETTNGAAMAGPKGRLRMS